jgi:hypothetical protein
MESNTIYDYYEKISERYYMARVVNGSTVKHLWNPLARKIVVPGYEEFDLFVYADNKRLILCEGLTGTVVLRQEDMPTRKLRRGKVNEVITYLPNAMKDKTWVNQCIINFLVDFEQTISPRYKAKEV